MTKKDYIKIAQVLKDNRPTITCSMVDLSRWNSLTLHMADMLQDDNPLFNREKFLNACGYND